MQDYLNNHDIGIRNGTDVNAVMRDMMSILLGGALDGELNEELGYSKYDYRNKDSDNRRNAHSAKTMHTSYGDTGLPFLQISSPYSTMFTMRRNTSSSVVSSARGLHNRLLL